MQEVGYAALQVIPSLKGFESSLERGTAGPLASAGRKGGAMFGDTAGKSMSSRFSSHAKAAALAAGAILAGAGALAFKIGKDSVAEAREAQRVGNITTNVIKSTGGAAHVTAKQVGELSTAISKKAGIDDEAIQSGANMLLTFKGIRDEVGKGNKIFDQATQITTDMAAAMAGGNGGQVDLKSSAILVGKALNDPAKGLTALTRVGVTFSDQQKTQIADLLKHNDVMGAQKVMLKELKSEFGGTAAAQATMGDKVKVAWGNIEEKIGTDLLPLIDKVERWFLHKGVPAVEGFFSAFKKKGVPAIKDFFERAKPVAESLLPTVKDGLERAGHAAKFLAPKIKAVVDHFNDMPDWVKSAVFGAGAMTYAGKKLGILGGSKVGGSLIGDLFSKAKPMPVFVTNPGFGGPVGPAGKIPPVVAAPLGLGGNVLSKLIPRVGIPFVIGSEGWSAFQAVKHGAADVQPTMTGDQLRGTRIGEAQGLERMFGQKGTINIDFDRLARSVQKYGDQSKYALSIQKQLQDGLDQGDFAGGGWLGDANFSKATGALHDINELIDKAHQAGPTTAATWRTVKSAIGDTRTETQNAAKGFGRINQSAGEVLDTTHKVGSVRIAPTYDPKGFGDARRNASDLLDLAHKANGIRVAPQVDTSGVNAAITRWQLLIHLQDQANRRGGGPGSTGGHVVDPGAPAYDPRIDLHHQKKRAGSHK